MNDGLMAATGLTCRMMRKWPQYARPEVTIPSTATAASAPGVNVACGSYHSAPGSTKGSDTKWMPAAIASGCMRVVARFMSGVEMP